MTNIEALELDYLPRHLIVLGGGYVGLELAQTYSRFGSRVTVVEAGPQLAGREDSDVAAEITEALRAEGLAIELNAKVSKVEGRSGVKVVVTTQNGVIEGTDLLVATGRTPNTSELASISRASPSMRAATSLSTIALRRRQRKPGRWVRAQVLLSSPTPLSMISVSSAITLQAARAVQKIV